MAGGTRDGPVGTGRVDDGTPDMLRRWGGTYEPGRVGDAAMGLVIAFQADAELLAILLYTPDSDGRLGRCAVNVWRRFDTRGTLRLAEGPVTLSTGTLALCTRFHVVAVVSINPGVAAHGLASNAQAQSRMQRPQHNHNAHYACRMVCHIPSSSNRNKQVRS